MTKRQTAAEAYDANRRDILAMIDMLRAELDLDAERAAAEPRNWGFTGTLGSVRKQFLEVLIMLTGRSEASIEDALVDAQK